MKKQHELEMWKYVCICLHKVPHLVARAFILEIWSILVFVFDTKDMPLCGVANQGGYVLKELFLTPSADNWTGITPLRLNCKCWGLVAKYFLSLIYFSMSSVSLPEQKKNTLEFADKSRHDTWGIRSRVTRNGSHGLSEQDGNRTTIYRFVFFLFCFLIYVLAFFTIKVELLGSVLYLHCRRGACQFRPNEKTGLKIDKTQPLTE